MVSSAGCCDGGGEEGELPREIAWKRSGAEAKHER